MTKRSTIQLWLEELKKKGMVINTKNHDQKTNKVIMIKKSI
jgi:hypothetical protein